MSQRDAPVLAADASMADPEVATRRALDALPGRSPNPHVCPFLRAIAEPETLVAPRDRPAAEHRCAAFGDPLAPSPLQQELVCLVASHVACPRYARGAAEVRAGLVVGGRSGGRSPAAVRLAGAAVVAAVLISLVFGLANGGLLGGATPTPSALAIASEAASPSPEPTPEGTPSGTPSQEASPTVTPPLTATAPPTATPGPTGIAARWAGLPRCPAPQTCYLYTVRRGDTFYGIATYFGTNVAGLKALNPAHASNTTIHVGEQLKIPPPPR